MHMRYEAFATGGDCRSHGGAAGRYRCIEFKIACACHILKLKCKELLGSSMPTGKCCKWLVTRVAEPELEPEPEPPEPAFFGSSGAGAVNLPWLRLRTKLKNNF